MNESELIEWRRRYTRCNMDTMMPMYAAVKRLTISPDAFLASMFNGTNQERMEAIIAKLPDVLRWAEFGYYAYQKEKHGTKEKP